MRSSATSLKRRGGLVCVAACVLAGPAPASPPLDTALVHAPGQGQLRLLAGLELGLHDDVELVVPASFLLGMPALGAKLVHLRWGGVWLSSRHQLSYPTPFLRGVSREGSLGLLPKTTDVPQALEWTSEIVLTGRLARRAHHGSAVGPHWVTTRLGFQWALAQESRELALLDFPFLYQRFADLYAPIVGRAGIGVQGALASSSWGSLEYLALSRGYLFSVDELDGVAVALETTFGIAWLPRRYRLELGLVSSLARFPIGLRMHHLPYLDFGYAF